MTRIRYQDRIKRVGLPAPLRRATGVGNAVEGASLVGFGRIAQGL
ncbi:TPA: hypothetical protein ACT2H7_002335 [Streptococcus suis]|nr:hypothetical protein [Streptococcus suis]WNF78132.1 hypothetical protein RJW55_01905 [Streptococcus suis]